MVPTSIIVHSIAVCRQQHLSNHQKTKPWTVNMGHILHRQLNSLSLKWNSRRCLWKRTAYAHIVSPRNHSPSVFCLPQDKVSHLTPLQYTELNLLLPSTSRSSLQFVRGGIGFDKKKYRIWRFWWWKGLHSYRRRRTAFHGWTLKARSCSECMLLSERNSGSLRSSLVKMALSFGWLCVMRLRKPRISDSCSASTDFAFSNPERSEETPACWGQFLNSLQVTILHLEYSQIQLNIPVYCIISLLSLFEIFVKYGSILLALHFAYFMCSFQERGKRICLKE